MARTNTKPIPTPAPRTHGGAVASRITPLQELHRSVCACLLFEDAFYESGESMASRIKGLVPQVPAEKVIELAILAREEMKLRHVPLMLVRELARHRVNVAAVLERIIQRPDEMGEFMALYWADRKPGEPKKVANSVTRGLAAAFRKFDAYALAKYNQENKIKLRDILFLAHPKPKDQAQEAMWKQLVDGTLPSPDTWEVALSAGKDKKATWERLMDEGKLGALALLRNLRNMQEARVSDTAVRQALATCRTDRVLPFRFVSAAKHAPKFEPELEGAMLRCLEQSKKLPGKTILVIDVSGSMQGAIGGKTDVSRVDTAAALAMLVREVCETPVIYATAGSDSSRVHKTELVPARRGFALRDGIVGSMRTLGGGGIFLRQCMDYVLEQEGTADRIIVLTDEVDCDHKLTPDSAPAFGAHNYLVNVAAYKNGIGYNKWTHISGWSEAILDFIFAHEALASNN